MDRGWSRSRPARGKRKCLAARSGGPRQSNSFSLGHVCRELGTSSWTVQGGASCLPDGDTARMRKLLRRAFVLGFFSLALTAPAGGGTILFLGDSLTAGLGVKQEQAYPALIQEKIREKNLSFEVINAGISGDTTAGGLARLDWVLQKKIDILVLALGANDGLRGLPVTQTK